jgi:hypothetical protein
LSKRIVNFSEDVDFKLKELKDYFEMPINKIITMIINEKLEDLKLLKKDYIEYLKVDDKQNDTAVFFRIKEKEKMFLEEQIKKTGNGSLTSEIRFRLLNTIYKNKFFLPVELEKIQNLIYAISKIGNNINQISRKINISKDLNSSDYEILQNSLYEVNIKIGFLEKELKNILEFTKNRD